jgi:hypothetical protein
MGIARLGHSKRASVIPSQLFELVFSPTAARRAVPALGLVTVVGLMLLARRRP